MALEFGPIVSEFIWSVSQGVAREFGVFGPRGEAKTIGALTAMIAHSVEHEKRGFKLPVPWMGVTDFHRSHKEKTVPSMLYDFWQGGWRLTDDDHMAIFRSDKDRVKLSLFGVEDQGAVDRVRRETCGLWVEEPAPATTGAGVDETTWNTAITSQRVATHAKVAMFTTNYPDDDHWTWERMKPNAKEKFGRHPEDESRMWFRVPKGDNPFISAETREEWAHALRERPDLAARLLEGRPGSIQQGTAVASLFVDGRPVGFNEEVHVAAKKLKPMKGEPFIVGQDFGHTPTTIIGQERRGFVNVLKVMACEYGGVKQHFENEVIPWFRDHGPWVLQNEEMILGEYDVAGNAEEESDIEKSPIQGVLNMLPGYWNEGGISWDARRGPMMALFNRSIGGVPALQIDPIDCEPLIKALRGRWYYKTDRTGKIMQDKPAKPNHPWEDIGDAFAYFCGRLGTANTFRSTRNIPLQTVSNFDPRKIQRAPVTGSIVTVSNFDPRRVA